MAQFYFDLSNDGGFLKDEEGQEFPDLDTAADAARQTIRELVAAEILDADPVNLEHFISIRDEQRVRRQIYFSEAVRFVESPG